MYRVVDEFLILCYSLFQNKEYLFIKGYYTAFNKINGIKERGDRWK